MATKRCECGGNLKKEMDATWNDTNNKFDFFWVWACNNCSRKTPVREYKRKTDKLTPSQEKAVEWIRTTYFKLHSLNRPDAHEIKTFETRMTDRGDVWVTIEVGMKNDEKTLASVFCRYRGMFLVGRKGAVEGQVYENGKFTKYTGYTALIYCTN